MALGKRKDVANYLPTIKFDSRSGVMNRADRTQNATGNWSTSLVDITEDFEAVVDLANTEIGWAKFTTGSPPDFKMVRLGDDVGDAPSDDHKEGFRLHLKLLNGAGSDVREFASTAKGLWQSVDELHDTYLDECGRHKDKLPIVTIAEVAKAMTMAGTFYRPVFKIKGWTKRPADLPASFK